MSALQAIPLTLLCLTVFASSAAAECAWVLWATGVDKATLLDKPWTVEAGFKSMDDCISRLDGVGSGNSDAVRLERTTLIMSDRRWHCLPDTVDPRWPRR